MEGYRPRRKDLLQKYYFYQCFYFPGKCSDVLVNFIKSSRGVPNYFHDKQHPGGHL